MRKKLTIIFAFAIFSLGFSQAAEYKRLININLDGSGDFTSINEAMEAIRAYMDYDVTVNIAPGRYYEKVVIPSWLRNVNFIGAGADSTIITYDHHANIDNMGTFRTYTVRVDASDVTFQNLTIENNAPQLGQAVALHTEGDRLTFINCKFLGNQDTIFLAGDNCHVWFQDCYIEGTTDFIFGPATALFSKCDILSKRNSYITAASTPENVECGFVFDQCKIIAAEGVDKVYLGRPWRPYANTVFINCFMDKHILPAGWHNWKNPDNEFTSRYGEYGSYGPGASENQRVGWAKPLTEQEANHYLQLANKKEL